TLRRWPRSTNCWKTSSRPGARSTRKRPSPPVRRNDSHAATGAGEAGDGSRRLGWRLGAADRTRTHRPRSDRNCATGCRQPRVLARPAARPARTGGATQRGPQRGRIGPATAPAGQPRRYRLQECAGMNVETARAEVFGDSLACEEVRPAAFVPGTLSPDAARAACLRGENLLRSLAV